MTHTRFIICSCASRTFIPVARVVGLAAQLRYFGARVTMVGDLCRMVEQNEESLANVVGAAIVACHSRAVRALLASRGLEAGEIIDIRSLDIAEALAKEGLSPASEEELAPFLEEARSEFKRFAPEVGHDAWFPAIDRERCVDCGRCLEFCLFGVYSREGRHVVVSDPGQCKNNCPACARVCPERAVVFPKYTKSPINGGLDDEEGLSALDPSALYAEALRTRLQQRRASVALLKEKKSRE